MIKNLSCLLLGFILCAALNAQTKQKQCADVAPDSAYLFHYPPCIQMLKVDYKDNRQTLRRLKQRLETFVTGKDTLYVNGYSGECDTRSHNLRTAFWRCIHLKGYLIERHGLREDDFKTVNIPYLHPDLGDIVLIGFSSPGGASVPPPVQEREQEAIVVAEANEPQPVTEKETQPGTTSPDAAKPGTTEPLPATNNSTPDTSRSKQPYVAIKTNLVAWAGTILNVAADVQVGKHVSLELPVLWCPWYTTDRHAVRTLTLQPEARYWLSKPGRGHFFGLHAHVGWFNVKWNDNRYQDTDRPLLGAGISYGYLLPLSAHWGAEFTLGAGYANSRYDTYYNIADGVRFDTQNRNYWGITRVGISFAYRFNAAR